MNNIQIGKVIEKRTLVAAESGPIKIPDVKNIIHLKLSSADSRAVLFAACTRGRLRGDRTIR